MVTMKLNGDSRFGSLKQRFAARTPPRVAARSATAPPPAPVTSGHGRHSVLAWALSAVLAAIVSVALAACGTVSNALSVSAGRKRDAGSAEQRVQATPVTAKACIDATASSDPEFADGVRQALVSAVATWVPPLPSGAPSTAEAAVPALTLWVRQVLTNSYSTQSPSLDLEISAVQPLPAPPQLSDPNLATDQLTWASREHAWRSATTQALEQEANAVAALRSYPLDHNARNWSAISGCTAALAGEGTQNASTRMLLASDLQENRPPVTANYAGAAILIDQNCPWTAQSCTSTAASWTARFYRQGIGSVAVVRADGAKQAIHNWLLGGQS